jgi:hypothetical protein
LPGCVYRIRMLVEPNVTGFEKRLDSIAITERIETGGPTDKNIHAQIWAETVFDWSVRWIFLWRSVRSRYQGRYCR